MQRNTIIGSVILLILGLGLGYVLWGSGPGVEVHRMSDGRLMSQDVDQHFIVQMIPHHEGAIAMAKVALERSKREEVLSLARGIIEAQEREIRDMKAWYEDWFNSTPPQGGMSGMHMEGMEGDMDELRAVSLAEFDREFLSQMIPHHEMAVMMGDMLKASSERPEMRTLADQIITSQSREIKMMQSWLSDWY